MYLSSSQNIKSPKPVKLEKITRPCLTEVDFEDED